MAFQIFAAIGRIFSTAGKTAVNTTAEVASHTAKSAAQTTAKSVTTPSVSSSPSVAPPSHENVVSKSPVSRPNKSEKNKNSVLGAVYDGLQLPRNEFVETLANKVAGWMKRLASRAPEAFGEAIHKSGTGSIPLTSAIYQVKDQSYMVAASDGISDYGPKRLSQSEVKTLQSLPADKEKQTEFRSQVTERHLSGEIEQTRNQGYSQSRDTHMKR